VCVLNGKKKNYALCFIVANQDSIVSVVTRLQAAWSRVWADCFLRLTQPPVQWVQRLFHQR